MDGKWFDTRWWPAREKPRAPVLANELAQRVLTAFGLPMRNAVAVRLELRAGELAKMTVEYLPPKETMEQVSKTLLEFELVPARPATGPAAGPVSVSGQTPPPLDAWGPPR